MVALSASRLANGRTQLESNVTECIRVYGRCTRQGEMYREGRMGRQISRPTVNCHTIILLFKVTENVQ